MTRTTTWFRWLSFFENKHVAGERETVGGDSRAAAIWTARVRYRERVVMFASRLALLSRLKANS